MRADASKKTVLLALLAIVGLLAGAFALIANSAQAQTVTDFNLSVSSGGLPTSGGSADVTIAITPGQSTIAAVGSTISYDSTLVTPTNCVTLVGLGACNLDTVGEVSVQTVDPSGWASTTDLFRLTFTAVALADTATLDIEVTEAYDVGGTLIAGEVTDGELMFRVNGDVNCSGTRTVADALFIAQFAVGNRTAVTTCPLPDPVTQINTTYADVSGEGNISTLDALRVAQCAVGLFDCEA